MHLDPIRDRELTEREFERFRLMLSTFCDGSGQSIQKVPWSVPAFRDFERVTAATCGGSTPENKGIFDVYVPGRFGRQPYGISCKMAGPALRSQRNAVFIEMANSAKKFNDELQDLSVDWRSEPEAAGPAVVRLVSSWHHEVPEIDVADSKYLLLTHSDDWRTYRLTSFALDLQIADLDRDVEWRVTTNRRTGLPGAVVGYIETDGRQQMLWQLYPESGGQLKYWPLLDWADWTTYPFELEVPEEASIREKARSYFPDLWPGF